MPLEQIVKVVVLLLTLTVCTPIYANHELKPDLSIGGRIKIDALYNSNSVSGSRKSKSDLAFSPRSIPLTDTRDDYDIHPRESRIWSTLYLPLFKQELSAYIEFDFFDTTRDSAGILHVDNQPRLRHLYASYAGLTFGKTYTTFVNMSAYPEINDGNGPLGTLTLRHELLRFQQELSLGEIAVSLEHAESNFVSTAGSRFQVNDDHLPDIIGKFTRTQDWGNLSFSAMFRQIHTNGRVINGNDDKTWGAAINTAGRIFINGVDNLRFSISYGNALGRYMSYGAFDDATMAANGDIDLTEIIAGYAAYQHWWSRSLRSSVILAAAHANIETGVTSTSVNKTFAASTLNLLWSPTFNATLGIEWLHGYRKQYDGQDGNIDRLQFSAVYKFQ